MGLRWVLLACCAVCVSVVGVGSAVASDGGVGGWSPVRIDSRLFESARLALASEASGEGVAGGGSVGVGLSDAAALSLAKREFPEELVSPVWSGPLFGEGARITGFASARPRLWLMVTRGRCCLRCCL